jgi:hypothetical protein
MILALGPILGLVALYKKKMEAVKK